jgi:hypothetical protein
MGFTLLIVMFGEVAVPAGRFKSPALACEAALTTFASQRSFAWTLRKAPDADKAEFVRLDCLAPITIPQRQVTEPSRVEYPFEDASK